MTRTRTAMTICLALAPTMALALPQWVTTYTTTYKTKATSPAGKAKCGICHVGMSPKLNPYGNDLKAALASMKTKVLTPAVLKAVAAKDSDKDGVKNGAEGAKGTLPGDPKSK